MNEQVQEVGVANLHERPQDVQLLRGWCQDTSGYPSESRLQVRVSHTCEVIPVFPCVAQRCNPIRCRNKHYATVAMQQIVPVSLTGCLCMVNKQVKQRHKQV